MSTDERLRQLLIDAAEAYEPPADGATRIVARAANQRRARRRVPTRRALQLTGAAAVVIGLLAALGFAVADSPSRSTASSKSAGGASAASSRGAGGAAAPAATGKSAPGNGTFGGQSGQPSAGVPERAARVVQSGQVALQVPHGQVRAALDRLGGIATGAGGYLSDSREDEDTGAPSATSTLRVPVADFASVVSQVRRVGRVVSSSSSARDVTGEYVDLGARISALQQTRATYLTLLSRAATIGDTLTVQQQVQQVQTQIEQLQGQQKVLADTSDLATLAVSVSEEGAPPPVHSSSSGFAKAWHRAAGGFNAGLQVVIGVAGPLLLALIVVSLLGLLGRQAYRLLRRWQL